MKKYNYIKNKELKAIKNYFIQEIDQKGLVSNKRKKVSSTLNYIEHIVTLFFAVTGCISISALASLFYISTGIMSSTIRLIICATTVKNQ